MKDVDIGAANSGAMNPDDDFAAGILDLWTGFDGQHLRLSDNNSRHRITYLPY